MSGARSAVTIVVSGLLPETTAAVTFDIHSGVRDVLLGELDVGMPLLEQRHHPLEPAELGVAGEVVPVIDVGVAACASRGTPAASGTAAAAVQKAASVDLHLVLP